jgi:riboflavin kinase/FMN adenylyltransferase
MMIDFTLDIAGMPAKEFITFLQERLRVRGLVVGPSFALGQGREGSVPTLKMLGAEMKFDVIVQEAETENGDVVSSSVIRDAISHGDVARAGNMMGRPFTLEGEVVRGHRRGTGLGFPTTNLKPEHDRILPGDGIYATWAVADDVRYPSATSIGVRPTFGPGWRTIETHIMDFKGDLYGKEIALEFVERLRDEIRFDSTAALKAQMTRDVEQARQILASRR